MKITPFRALIISFATWMLIGVFLLQKGLKLLVGIAHSSESSILTELLSSAVSSREHAVLLLITLALLMGFLKGRMVLSKTVTRISNRFFSFGSHMTLKQMYPTYYIAIILSMMFMGMTLRFVPISADLKGVVDVAVGSALINGAMQYFRLAFTKGKGIEVK